MSPRRKSGLSPEDLQALKHLPAVLTALEHLQEQHAKVRALMRPGVLDEADELRRRAQSGFGPIPGETERWTARRQVDEALQDPIHRPNLPQKPINPTLDTPERQEYEAAKKAGRKVPVVDPFANISPAQRERMEEQRAFLDAERAAKGLPTSSGMLVKDKKIAALVSDPPEDVEVVRTEPLDTVSDGTTPLAADADDDPEVH